MPDNTRLVEAAVRLRAGAHGDTWDNFLMAMREYAAHSTTEILRASPDMLYRAQGMAIAANEISSTLVKAPEIYEKTMQGKRNG